MKKTSTLRKIAGFSFIMLFGTGLSISMQAAASAGNTATERTECHSNIPAVNIGEETALALSNEAAVTAWGSLRKNLNNVGKGKACIKKRFGILGRRDRFDRKRLPVIKVSM